MNGNDLIFTGIKISWSAKVGHVLENDDDTGNMDAPIPGHYLGPFADRCIYNNVHGNVMGQLL